MKWTHWLLSVSLFTFQNNVIQYPNLANDIQNMRSFYAETCVGVTYIFVFRETKKCGGRGDTGHRRGGQRCCSIIVLCDVCDAIDFAYQRIVRVSRINRLLNFYKIRDQKNFLFEIYLKYWHSMGTSVSFFSIRAASSPIELQQNSWRTKLNNCSQPLKKIITEATTCFNWRPQWRVQSRCCQPCESATSTEWEAAPWQGLLWITSSGQQMKMKIIQPHTTVEKWKDLL